MSIQQVPQSGIATNFKTTYHINKRADEHVGQGENSKDEANHGITSSGELLGFRGEKGGHHRHQDIHDKAHQTTCTKDEKPLGALTARIGDLIKIRDRGLRRATEDGIGLEQFVTR